MFTWDSFIWTKCLCLRESQRRRGLVGLRGDDEVVVPMPNGYVIPFSTYALSRRCKTLNMFRLGWVRITLAGSFVAIGMVLSCIAGDGMYADSIRPHAEMVFRQRRSLRSHQMASYQRNNSYFVKGRGVCTHLSAPPPVSCSVPSFYHRSPCDK